MTKFGADLIESLADAVAHAKGELSSVTVQTVEAPDAHDIARRPGEITKGTGP